MSRAINQVNDKWQSVKIVLETESNVIERELPLATYGGRIGFIILLSIRYSYNQINCKIYLENITLINIFHFG